MDNISPSFFLSLCKSDFQVKGKNLFNNNLPEWIESMNKWVCKHIPANKQLSIFPFIYSKARETEARREMHIPRECFEEQAFRNYLKYMLLRSHPSSRPPFVHQLQLLQCLWSTFLRAIYWHKAMLFSKGNNTVYLL